MREQHEFQNEPDGVNVSCKANITHNANLHFVKTIVSKPNSPGVIVVQSAYLFCRIVKR